MEFLYWIIVLITIVTLVGHGVWVAIAALLRAMGGTKRVGKCPVCRATLESDPHSCAACHWSARGRPEEGPLRISLRMLERAQRCDMVDKATLRDVGAAMIQATQTAETPPPGNILREPRLTPESSGIPETGGAETGPALEATPSTPQKEETPLGETKSTTAKAPTPPADRLVPDVAQRARRFAKRQTEPLAGTATTPEARAKVKRTERMPWSKLLSAFMLEKNIRWGEVVGGLLIVSSSIALVVSFWEHIATRPLLKFGIFTGVTASLFGLGLHASHRWKLPTTSRGMLMIAMMLVPLNFLALASFAEASELTAITTAGEFVTLGIFLLLGYYASRILAPRFPWLTNLVVVGLAFYNLPIRRFLFAEPTWQTLYVVAVPMVVAYLGCLWPIGRRAAVLSTDDQDRIEAFANQVWILLGLASFAFALATGFLIVRTEQFGGAFQRLSPLIMLAAAPSILTGARFWQSAKDRDLRSLLIPSCGVALAGIGVMLAGIGLSWPIPWLMITTCALGALMCVVLAIWLKIPETHIGAAALLSAVFALTGLVAGGTLALDESNGQAVLSELLSVATGSWYTGFSVLMLGVAISLRFMSRLAIARSYAIGAVGGGLVGAALITTFGFGRHEHSVNVSIAYATYAVLFYLAAHYLHKSWWQWLSGAAIAGACFQGIYFGLMHDAPLLYRLVITLLTASAIYAVIAIAEQVVKPRELKVARLGFQWPFETLALAGCMLTTVVACGAFAMVSPRPVPWAWAGIATLWFASAWRYTDRPMLAMAQLAAIATMALAIDDYARTCDWYSRLRFGWLHPYGLELQAAGLAVFGAVWLGVRWGISRWSIDGAATSERSTSTPVDDVEPAADAVSKTIVPRSTLRRAHWLARATPWTVDELATATAVAIAFALSVYAAAPGVLQELLPADAAPAVVQALAPQNAADAIPTDDVQDANARMVVDTVGFELFGIPHNPIGTSATWWLLALVLAVTFAGLLQRGSVERLTLFVTATASVVYLLAMRWEPIVSVASAMRWYLAAFFLIGNALLWRRRLPDANESRSKLFGILCAHTFLPLIAMAVCVAVVALQIEPPGPADLRLMFWLLVVGVVGLGLIAGERRATAANWLSKDSAPRRRTITVSTAILACMPGFAITLYVVGTSLAMHPVTGPDPESHFARMGLAASYSGPILLVALALAGTAIAFASASIGLWAGIVLNIGGTAAYLLNLGASGFDLEHWLQLAQINATISALFALGWLGVARWQTASGQLPARQDGLRTQINLACGFFSIAMVGVLSVLWWNPRVPVALLQAAVPWGWLSVACVVAACFAAARLVRTIPLQSNLPGLAIAISALIGCHLQDRLPGEWDVSYTVIALVAVSSAFVVWRMTYLRLGLMHALDEQASIPSDHGDRVALTARLRWWVYVVVWILTLFALRFLDHASERPWPTAIFLLAAAALAGMAGWIEMRWRALWWSAILVNLTLTVVWLLKGRRWQFGYDDPRIDLLYVNVLAATLPTLGWVLVLRHWKTRSDATGAPPRASAIHRYLVPTAVVLLVGLATIWMNSALGGSADLPNPYLSLTTIIVVGFACWACFWDGQIRWQSLGLYATGLCGAVAVLQWLRLSGEPLTSIAPLVFGAYGLSANYLISRGVEMRGSLARLRLLPPTDESQTTAIAGGGLLVIASCLLAGVTVALALLAQFRCDDQALRVGASQSIFAQAWALAMLTRRRAQPGDEKEHGISTSALRFGALGLGVVAVIANGWSYFDPSLWLPYERMTVVAIACSLMALVYGLGLVRLLPSKSPWIDTARQLMPALIAMSAALVCAVMALEIVRYIQFETELPVFAIAGIAVTLGITFLACMVAALVPGRDPLGLSDRARVVYVYAAEVALLLIVIHLRVSMPWLFSGLVQQIWPLMIMSIAFTGIGLSEWARRYSAAQSQEGEDRSRYGVLVGPMEQTGVILPLLPALGYWMLPSVVHYSLVMVVVGLGYGVLAQMRKSFGFSVLAALAANGSLWFLLHDNAIGLLSHPQVWLIPPALCVLIAAQLNRKRLSPEQVTGIRYACSTVIYVSSTAEIFMTGVAEAPWLPLVLAGFSLAGIAVGIAAQIRAFLWLGLSFLAVSMMTIIWYAAVDLHQTWLWYVTGIVAGVIILAVFAFFEKRRADVLRWADKLKQWEA
jgi:hypothetical protein